ncbi:SDR family NAD(P)-dependent oxidoreductase [Thauera sp.]|jgi:acyl transferase domain-containing protein/NADPH:quinone reductase-like Zn-dependent oxidoreductase/acyl carrier protein|uniref:SDR family NAD(P)-dependent oxidoreductase n=1 Tax=Thauera sp. TaxID=1905334 RepID=UPI002A36CAA7|nr:SDR family NAD(P)-dependent oxidoreductase [Thauera sp.]MDX9886290.1 SDR family NAD(P)-dependent oxidoreductase [Thauera sp.]
MDLPSNVDQCQFDLTCSETEKVPNWAADTTSQVTPIAIVGLAFRFPGDLSDEQSFWQALTDKRDLITEVPSDRWAVDELQHARRAEPGRSITFSAGVLSRIDEFDAGFFGISPREAAWLDPQQRLLLEMAWEAMENAQIPASSLAGTQCAVYVGISGLDYGIRSLDDLASMTAHSMTGNTLSLAANRLSYVFDLHGPSLAVDTACSSSLVALHHACMALQAGEAMTALVGGVNLLLHPYPFVGFTKASMLSADGRCKAFDGSGNGYVRAEGGAVLLLKPLDQALADGDDIQAVIRATGVNADGARKTGITIPSRDGQAELMRTVLGKSGLAATDIDFVEAHGTGTAVGDPIEAAAIGSVYGQGRDAPLPIGSVKANLGHLEPASGMAGLVKAVLGLKNRALPPQIHLETLNPNIDFERLNLEPVTKYHLFAPHTYKPLIAGVNSFGFGGANAHVLLQEYRQPDAPDQAHAPVALPPLLLSARSYAALRELAARYADRLRGQDPQGFYDIAHAVAHRRERLETRLALAPTTIDQALASLSAFARGTAAEGCMLEDALPHGSGIAFIYSGNGAQWVGMGVSLLAESPRFTEIIAELDAKMQPVAGFSLLAELQADASAARLDDTVIAQPLLFAIQVAVTSLLREQGVVPHAVAGHSVGEVAAAWAAGAFNLDEAICIIVARSKAQGQTRGAGRMAAVGMSASAIEAVIAECSSADSSRGLGGTFDIAVAGINSPDNVTLSGSLADLERLQAYLKPRGTFFRLLDLDYAFHSRHMDPIAASLLDRLAGLSPRPTVDIAYVSTVTGDVLDGSLLGASYWWRNVREPVRFADAVARLAALDCRAFVEIGPNAILQRYIRECVSAVEGKVRVLSTLRKGADGWGRIVDTALRAHLLAAKPQLQAYFPVPGRHVRLPNYPWQRERHWHPRTSEGLGSFERRRVHPLLGWRIPDAEWTWENTLDPVVVPWIGDHKVGAAVVFPGSAYAEMALAAAREWLGGDRFAFEELDIVSPLVFAEEHARSLRLTLSPRDGSFQIKSRQRLSNDEWTLHAAGRLLQAGTHRAVARIAPPPASATCISGATHYHLARTLGLDYGPAFQRLTQARVADTVLEASVQDPADDTYLIHPALLDTCYQSLVDFFCADIESGQGVALLPVKASALTLHRRGIVTKFRAKLRRRSARSVLADFELLDADDQLVATVSGCRFRAAPLGHRDEGKVAHWRIVPWLQPHPMDARASELPVVAQLAEHIHEAMATLESQRKLWFKEALPLFEALVLSFAHEAFRVLAQRENGLQALATSASPYARWLADLLRQEALLVQEEGAWTLVADSGLPASEEIWKALRHEHPACLPQLVLMGRVGLHLSQLLAGELDANGFAHDLAHAPAAETLYEDDPAYFGVRQAVHHALLRIAHSVPGHRRLRVLEIAAGPSELPRTLLDALPEDRLDYVLALPHEATAARQQTEYTDFANLTVATLSSTNWKLSADKPLPDVFDVVIVRHALHKALSPEAAVSQVRDWLATGGLLLLAERRPDWSADFINGLAPDWWHDTALPDLKFGAPNSCLLPPQAWEEALRQQGFDDVQSFEELAAAGLAEGAYLVLARRPQTAEIALQSTASESWLLIADDASAELAQRLQTRLETAGQRVEIAPSLKGCELAEVQHVVRLQGWAATRDNASSLLSEALLDVQALAMCGGKPPRLWLMTRGGALASELPASVRHNPEQAALWGFGRVVMNEHPALETTLIDLHCALDAPETLARLENELLRPDNASEIVLANPGRYTLVMREEPPTTAPTDQGADRFRLDFRIPGQLRNLLWLAQAEQPLGASEVEVRTQATGLNFRDVMYLMGLLPDEAVESGFAGASLGLEFSGVVARIGADVHDIEVGDKVMGFGAACFASHVVTRRDAVSRMPEQWSFEAAATVPTVFLTVYYALQHLAALQPGERVLIHGAAGGVGIAAIQLAKHLGAEVFATAGSDDKRDFVRLLGADHVFDSRTLDFADDILAATNDEGVDVILNSLAGEAIRRNLRVLKPFGRFLELGKRDFFENTPIGLRPFKDNISYFGIDADQLLTARPTLAARMFGEMMELFREGVLSPLPYRVFHADRVVDAFRVMQQARHIGKVVVSLNNARPQIRQSSTAHRAFQPAKDSTWLITGGLSGFGLESARWLAAHGVGNLVLVSRRGVEVSGAAQAIEELGALGVKVQAHACDITDAHAVAQLVDQLRDSAAPLTGVLHAAMVIDDKLIANLDPASMDAVLRPKLVGAWNLHQATLGLALEHFVLYSSITTSIGNPGQANYVAANAALEGFAEMRRQMGLPAAAIGWGPIGDVGYLTRNTAVRDSLAQRLGRPPLSAQQALSQLEHVLIEGSSRAVANFDWNALARLLPSAGCDRFAILNRSRKHSSLSDDDADFRALIAGKTPDEVAAIVQQLVTQEVAQILAISPDRIDRSRSLHDLGLDSLMAVELALGLEQRLGIPLPVMMLNESPTAEKVTQRIVHKLLGGAEADDAAASGAEAVVQDLVRQHGESMAAEDVHALVEDARALTEQGRGLTQ